MSTVVELTDQELADLKAFTGQANDAAAIRSAINEFLRNARRTQLQSISGRSDMKEDWQTVDTIEMRAVDSPSGSATD